MQTAGYVQTRGRLTRQHKLYPTHGPGLKSLLKVSRAEIKNFAAKVGRRESRAILLHKSRAELRHDLREIAAVR